MGLDDKRVYLETAFNNWIKDRATWIFFPNQQWCESETHQRAVSRQNLFARRVFARGIVGDRQSIKSLNFKIAMDGCSSSQEHRNYHP